MPVSLCPLVSPDSCDDPPAPVRTADPTSLSYSFTIPGESRSAAVARRNVQASLCAHGLTGIAPPVLQVVGELVACAVMFEPGQNLYLSLNWRDDALRTVLWDPHPSHRSEPAASLLCADRRRRMLLLLACVARECGGDWGIDTPGPGAEGTKVWAVLPYTGAAAYARQG
ncbi:ATP-binding protein [Streptomyces luteireticuli]|uniref:ATP-binding protein n=1 Tax=Streptomyces luteireticuli TaxID=173858 RepID=UPI0035582510